MARNIKEVPLGEYNFKIKQFTPEVACFWALRLLGTATDAALGNPDAINNFINMQRKDFNTLMFDSLSVVNIEMESGLQPFYNPDGGYALGTPDNTLVFKLVVQAFTFSLAPFLSMDLRASLQETLSDIFQKPGPETSSSSQ